MSSSASTPRRSACAEAARKTVEARTAGLTQEQREARAREFNASLVQLLKSGRFAV